MRNRLNGMFLSVMVVCWSVALFIAIVGGAGGWQGRLRDSIFTIFEWFFVAGVVGAIGMAITRRRSPRSSN